MADREARMSAASELERKTVFHLPENFRRICLERIDAASRPRGKPGEGYILWAPLDEKSAIETKAWLDYADYFRLVKYSPGEANEIGHLMPRSDGSWTLHYDIAGPDEDSPDFRLEAACFTPGALVSISEANKRRIYCVRGIKPY
jgi:hypothetical protein